jgi:hypothetical protein
MAPERNSIEPDVVEVRQYIGHGVGCIILFGKLNIATEEAVTLRRHVQIP